MTPDSTELMYAVYVMVFIGIILAFEGVRQLLSRTEAPDQARNRRMRMLKSGKSNEEVLSILLDDANKSKKRFAIPSFGAMLRQAGFAVHPIWLFAVMLLLGLLGFVWIEKILDIGMIPSAVLASLMGIIMPIAIVQSRRGERLKLLNKQLPDALDLMARGLKVGHPLNVTVASVAHEMPDPIGTEFGIIQGQIEYGDELPEAFNDFADRVGLEDARYLAVSVGIQHGTGGNLARVLHVLSKVIRDRSMMQKRIKAISAEGRISAVILTALPFLIFGLVMVGTPTFYGDVMDDPMFMPIAIAVITLITLQGIILNRLVSFKF